MAGGGSHKGDGPKKARIEIIPLIDVIFFLLATFVLFTLSLNKSNGLSVQLPKVENSGPRDPSNSVTISITDNNEIGWDKDTISLEEFVTRIHDYSIRVGPENARIFINGDENANYSSARYVIDQIKRTQIQKIMIETRIVPDAERQN
ncbi:biopolymer transport protein ExbD [Ereboglobus sp. PH5-5]|uniref:ExbD/TolR family protein n=1 Tax=Ereboglobus sp. PH5-5 TaxID=2940529 RepID=UPI002406D803|nr:biopolymer transporter ExbD [Ereboglobus sp. PH5-5]MDF9834136.1 biopolymer transport protein ExbD [Ereboglobus sp. PH5-5]